MHAHMQGGRFVVDAAIVLGIDGGGCRFLQPRAYELRSIWCPSNYTVSSCWVVCSVSRESQRKPGPKFPRMAHAKNKRVLVRQIMAAAHFPIMCIHCATTALRDPLLEYELYIVRHVSPTRATNTCRCLCLCKQKMTSPPEVCDTTLQR